MKPLKKTSIALIASGVVLISSIPYSSYAKEGIFDMYLTCGYGIPIGGENQIKVGADSPTDGEYLQDQTWEQGNLTNPIEVKDHYLNYGKGIQIEGGLNYLILESVAFRLACSFTTGIPSLKVEYENPNNPGDFGTDFTETFKYNLLGFKVMLIPRFELLGAIDTYAGVGFGLFFTFLKIDNDDKQRYSYEGHIKTKPTVALHGLLGADYPLSDLISAYFEFSFDEMSFTTKSRVYTADHDGGTQEDYVKNSNESSEPIKIPGSNIGLRLGIRFHIK